MTKVLKPAIHLTTNGTFVGDLSAMFDTCIIILGTLFQMPEDDMPTVTHTLNRDAKTSISMYVSDAVGDDTEQALQTAILTVLGQPDITCTVKFEVDFVEGEEDWNGWHKPETARKIERGMELARQKLYGFAA